MLKVVYSPEYEAKKEVELPKELRKAAYMIGGGALAATITANRKRLLGEAGEHPKTEPQAEPFTSENANSGNELMIDEADVKTILDEWLSVAVQCDEKDIVMLQNQCADELYAFVVNNLTTDDELAGVFADMTAHQIRAATAYIAKELFGMNMELHSTIIRNTDSIVEQFEKALWRYDKSTNNKEFLEKTVFDKLVEAAKKDNTAQSHDKNTIYHFINSILLYIAENVNDENDDYEGVTVRDVVEYDACNEVYKLVDCAKWVVEQVFAGNNELMEVIKSYTDAAEQFEAIYEKYELDGYEVDIDMRLIRSSYAQLIAAISNAKSAISLPYVKSTIPLIKSMNAMARKSMNAATLTAMKIQERIL